MNFYEQIFSRGRATGEGMTHFERLFAAKFGGSPPPEVREYTGTVPVTITADGTPLLDYIISGNTVQNGTPTPTTPIQPSECGERTGNLFDWNWLVNGYHLGSQTGLPTTHPMRVSILQPIDVSQLTTATISYESIDVETLYAMYSVLTTENTLIRRVTSVASGSTLDLSGGDKLYIAFYNGASSGATAITKDNITNIMLNLGSTPQSYEPYGIKIPISSANTTTPVYLGEVESTRRIKKVVLDGTEAFFASGSWGKTNTAVYYTTVPNTMNLNTNVAYVMCSHYVGASRNYIYDNDIECSGMTGSNSLTFRVSRQYAGTKEDFLAYLAAQYAAGTPVTVWHVLANEETGIVNEPLMRIGDYADTLSKAQAVATIPTSNGSTTIDVDTTVKPSEVYIKYMG